jgi:class 3 adenylate cyclase/tetratricopeptide (TPR) repeat protein
MPVTCCPICDEPVQTTEKFCESCGAALPEGQRTEDTEAAIEAKDGAQRASKGEKPEVLSAAVTDELIAAFQHQFENHSIYLPQKWIARLRSLAVEVEASRRFATIFFVDLRGYTRLSQEMTEEQLDRLRQWFYELGTRRVEQYGGFVIQFAGDAIFAAFGAPWAFERDTESAIRALIDIRNDIRTKGDFEGFPLGMRAGADFGSVNVRLTDVQGQPRPDLFGSTVNLSARLEDRADSWEILISDNMALQVQQVFTLEPREPWTPKNYGRIVEPYAVTGLRDDADLSRRSHEFAYVGNESRLQQLTRAIADAASGAFGVRWITGEAGAGKTRLVLEAIKAHDAGIQPLVAFVGCEPHYRFSLLAAAMRLLGQVAARLTSHSEREVQGDEAFKMIEKAIASSESGLAILPTIGYLLRVQPHLSNLSSAPANVLRDQSVAALAECFAVIAMQNRPLVLVIDDLQWCDRLTREVLDTLSSRKPAGILIIQIGRDTAISDDLFDMPADISESRHITLDAGCCIEVSPLTENEREQLLGQVISREHVHPLLWRRVIEESEGIPLYLVEMARDIAAREIEDEDRADIHHAGGDYSIQLPPTILGVLQARLDRLTSHRRSVLQSAAVLGRRFSYNVASLYSTLREDLLGELYALKGLSMLRDEPEISDIHFVFTPTALRNAAYLMLTQTQRESLHRKAAELIESKFSNRLNDFCYDLSIHWLKAKNPARARKFLRMALHQAIQYGVPHEAYDLMRRGLQKDELAFKSGNPADGSTAMIELQQKAILEEAAGRACRMIGDFPRAATHFQVLLAIASQVKNPLWAANAHHQLSITAIEQGNLAEAEENIQRAHQEASEDSIPRPMKFRLLNTRAILAYRLGNLESAIKLWTEIAENSKTGRSDRQIEMIRCDALNNLGLACWQMGKLAEAESWFNQALELCTEQHNQFGRVNALCNRGIVLEKQARFADAEKVYSEANAAAEAIGYFSGLSAVESNRANIALLRQDFAGAEIFAARALRFARINGHRPSEAIALDNLALALAALGQQDRSLECLREALSIADSGKDHIAIANATLARAWIYLQARELTQCADAVSETPANLPETVLHWHETISASVDSLASGIAARVFALDSLESFRQTATAENYLRRLDAISLLIHDGITTELTARQCSDFRNQVLRGSAEA